MRPLKPAEVVTEFYRAVGSGDADAVSRLVEGAFHKEATMTWPGSLPYGGTLAGRDRLAKVLAAAAGGAAPAGPKDVHVVGLVVGTVSVAVELEFVWTATASATAVASGAVEWWTFDDQDAVVSITAYYWDTAALLGS